MVLEPKKGIIQNFVATFDYKSLYPSIISEFNVCFTSLKAVAHYPITKDEIAIERYMEEIRSNISKIKYRTLLPQVLDKLTKARDTIS